MPCRGTAAPPRWRQAAGRRQQGGNFVTGLDNAACPACAHHSRIRRHLSYITWSANARAMPQLLHHLLTSAHAAAPAAVGASLVIH